MPRDHGRIRLDIWADDEWRCLPSIAQWLYLHLVTSPTLNFCGVADWRPARIAALAEDLTGADVEYAAKWLEAGLFVLIDRDTEEALVRSWIKHDGLIASQNITKAMLKSFAQISSATLRGVVVGQVQKIAERSPSLDGVKVLGDLLDKRSIEPSDALSLLPSNPSVTGSVTPLHTPLKKGR